MVASLSAAQAETANCQPSWTQGFQEKQGIIKNNVITPNTDMYEYVLQLGRSERTAGHKRRRTAAYTPPATGVSVKFEGERKAKVIFKM